VVYKPQEPYCRWVNENGVAFELARTDWHYVANTFCFGYGVGYKFSASGAGAANGNFLGLGADSCRRAVLVEQAQPPGLLITNGEFVGRWSSIDSVCVEIGPEAAGKVSLVNCSFWGPIDRCVWMRSAPGQFTASACHFVNWDNHGQGAPAIQLDAGKAIVQGCTFAKAGTQVHAGERVRSAILLGNQAEGGFHAVNLAGPRVQLLANEPDPLAAPEARLHYRIVIGASGDDAYLRNWHGRERSARSMRWSADRSYFRLPVTAGKPYRMTCELEIPGQAESPDAGIYLDGERLALLTPGTVDLPARKDDWITLELRCRGWIPREVHPGSQDGRMLGVSGFSVVMKAEGAGDRLFDVNVGDYVEERPQDGSRK
jgi:hypothetical protein